MKKECKIKEKFNKRFGNKRIKTKLILIVSFLFIILSVSALWSNYYFGKLSFNQIVYAFSMPLKGTDHNLILSYVIFALVPSLLLTLLIYVIHNLLITNRVFKSLSRDRSLSLSKRFLSFVTIFSIIVSFFIVESSWKVSDYILATSVNSDFIENHYHFPGEKEITFPEKKRNLIYVYLESMETSYQNINVGGGFEVSRIPELTKLSDENISFSRNDKHVGAFTPYNTTWTIAGMVSQTSGLPFNIPVGRNNMSNFEEFMPGVKNLGDILYENGYSNHIMFGSDSEFAGRDKYYKQHGNYEIYDLNWALDRGLLPEGENDFWGFQDSRLFQFAKTKLDEIAREDEPFNFTLLTVDTHAQDGFLNEFSSKLFEDQYSNVIKGSSRQVYEFVNWIKTKDWYENTTIVLVGDHLTMDKNYHELMDENTQRGVYNCIINPPEEITKNARYKNRDFTTMDFFPTILASLGCEIEGDSLGLGVNLFSDKKTLAEMYSFEYLNQEFEKTSKFYYREFLGIDIKDEE